MRGQHAKLVPVQGVLQNGAKTFFVSKKTQNFKLILNPKKIRTTKKLFNKHVQI